MEKNEKVIRKLEIEQAKKIDREITLLQLKIRKNIRSYKDPDRLDAVLPKWLNEFEKELLATLKGYNVKAAEARTLQETEKLAKYLSGISGSSEWMIKVKKDGANFVLDIRKSILIRKALIDGISIGERVSTIKNGALKTVRNILYEDIKKGKSWADIAKDIDQYIAPEKQYVRVAPWEFYRRRFGEPVSFDVRKTANIPSGSVSYNAHRIARTEISQTWREATVEVNDGKPWVEGFNWNLSASHPVYDICDDWAAASPYKNRGDLPVDHPNGLCYITTQLVPRSKLKL